ncbi:MAG: hypothetical protein JXN64_12155 [Spirochaetes bacterium]|nr:hypothetical protein [Spirochaetota bacterium]
MRKAVLMNMFIIVIINFFACSKFFRSSTNVKYKQFFINTSKNPPLLDGVELGYGRNDGTLRIYTPRDAEKSSGYEYSFTNNKWSSLTNFNSTVLCVSPVITDLKKDGSNSLFLGGWNDLGVITMKYSNAWPEPSVLPRSSGKGIILAMNAGNGRNDGINRLYVAHWSDSGLVEYSWTGKTYVSNQLMNKSTGRFALGQGRNDGINRLYAVERGGTYLHEFTWNGNAFSDNVVFSGTEVSNGSVYVADGRGDGVNRVYVWAGGLFELTYKDGSWSSFTLDPKNLERYYITAGTIRIDKKPGIYVSVKQKGLHEYIWSEAKGKFEVDAITGATGGCTIGDGRGDGKNRLYVAKGSKGYYKKAAIVEIWEEEKK